MQFAKNFRFSIFLFFFHDFEIILVKTTHTEASDVHFPVKSLFFRCIFAKWSQNHEKNEKIENRKFFQDCKFYQVSVYQKLWETDQN